MCSDDSLAILWRVRRCIPFFLLFILVSGCSRQGRQADVLRLAVESDASTLDPARAYDTSSIPFVRVIYRGLVDYDKNANVVNEVAIDRRVSADGRSYWFKLRDDVLFHRDETTGASPGRRVVAEDFRYALERILDPATASDGLALSGYHAIVGATEYSKACGTLNEQIEKATAALASARGDDVAGRKAKLDALRDQKQRLRIPGIEVRGDDEITFRLKQADATFFNYLALPFAYAVPRETVEKYGDGFSDHPNGCGPYQLEEWVHDAWIRLKKNPHYFNPQLPKAERIEVEMGNSTALQIMRFERGDLDVIDLTSAFPPDFLRLRNDEQWQPYLEHAPMMDVRYLSLNCELPPLNNVKVRQALNYAVDRARIASFLAGRATLAKGVLPPGMPGYNDKLFQYDYNPRKAKTLLKEAGYKDEAMTLWYSTREGWYEKAAQSIKQDFAAAGVTVNLKAVRYPELKAQAGKRKNLHMALMGWIQDFPDPSNFLDVLFNTKAITDTASQNRAFYSNPEVDKLLDEALTENNRTKRLKMYQQVEQIIVRDAPWLFLHHTERYVAAQPWVKGYKLHPMWSEVYEVVEVKR